MKKVFIRNLPKGTSILILTTYLASILNDKFVIKKTKNKGRKIKIHAFLQLSSEEDLKKIYSMNHFVNGTQLEIKEYINNSKTFKNEQVPVLKKKQIDTNKVFVKSKSDVSNKKDSLILNQKR